MAVPWLKIIQWVPSILDVSKELLRKTQTELNPPGPSRQPDRAFARIAALEENERRQAELITRMAEQLGQLAEAVTYLHKRVQVLMVAVGVIGVVAAAAMAVAILAVRT